MKVLMTADAVGGVWTYVAELCTALSRAGVEVSLVTMGPRPSDAQRRMLGGAKNVALFETDFALEWMDDPWDDVAAAGKCLLALERSMQPDVVHLNGYAHAALPFTAPVVAVAHSCVLSWWQAVKHEDAPPRYDVYRAVVHAGVHGADALVAPSRAMLDAVERYYEPVEHGVVIPNGRDSAQFSPAEKAPVILSAGRVWDEAKNIEAVDRVAPLVPWQVRIAGEAGGPVGKSRSVRHARALGPLAQAELAHEMAQASIFTLPARYEPFGLSVLEAALSGCALVLGDISSLRELWDRAAVFVSPDDDDALGMALARVVGDSDAREWLGAAARARALELSPERMAGRYLDLYRALLVRRAAEARSCAS